MTFTVHFSVSYSKSRNILAACGEDGVVKVWDCRESLSQKPAKQFSPATHQMTKRREKYLSAVSVRGDWLATGGGPSVALWHIGKWNFAMFYRTIL